jgi:SRSO17 transposase
LRGGKTDNCQIAVTLSIANHAASLPIAYRLYLPEDWAGDEVRRKKVRVPDEVKFRTNPRSPSLGSGPRWQQAWLLASF